MSQHIDGVSPRPRRRKSMDKYRQGCNLAETGGLWKLRIETIMQWPDGQRMSLYSIPARALFIFDEGQDRKAIPSPKFLILFYIIETQWLSGGHPRSASRAHTAFNLDNAATVLFQYQAATLFSIANVASVIASGGHLHRPLSKDVPCNFLRPSLLPILHSSIRCLARLPRSLPAQAAAGAIFSPCSSHFSSSNMLDRGVPECWTLRDLACDSIAPVVPTWSLVSSPALHHFLLTPQKCETNPLTLDRTRAERFISRFFPSDHTQRLSTVG